MSRPPEPTSADLAAWRRLVRLSRQSAADPTAPAGDLAKAEKVAKRAIVLGRLNAENPCVRLVRTARQFVSSTTRQRRELAAQMTEACDLVEARLKGAAGADDGAAEVPPARRHRADLDG